jgi:cell division protein FtsB
MRWKLPLGRPLLTMTQLLALLALIAGLIIALDLNRRGQGGRLAGEGEEALQAQLAVEETRQVALTATLTYVQSDHYVAEYARGEGGYRLSGEKRIVPLLIETTPVPTPIAAPTADPAEGVYPWQVWWQLLTDAPPPSP